MGNLVKITFWKITLFEKVYLKAFSTENHWILLKYLSLVDKKIIKNWGESLDSHFCQILWNFLELILWENIGDRLLLHSTPKIWNISNSWRNLLRKSPWSWLSSAMIKCIVSQVNLGVVRGKNVPCDARVGSFIYFVVFHLSLYNDIF